MKGKGLGELKGEDKEGKGKFISKFFWGVQLKVLGDADTAETDSQTVRQTDYGGRQARQTSEVRLRGRCVGEDVVLISARLAVCRAYHLTIRQGHHHQ